MERESRLDLDHERHMERESGRQPAKRRAGQGKGRHCGRANISPFKRQAHALVDELPDDGTWQQLAERVEMEIELEAAVLECERQFAAQQPPPK